MAASWEEPASRGLEDLALGFVSDESLDKKAEPRVRERETIVMENR